MKTGDNGDDVADYTFKRIKMVERQIISRGVSDSLVIKAMRTVPRHLFIPEVYQNEAYDDGPLPIGYGQTISQPYIVALMTELMHLKGGEKVLEIGTGSGYQAAILSEIAGEVHTIEIVSELCHKADSTLRSLGYKNVYVHCGDGYRGLRDEAPFDAVMLTAAPNHIPPELIKQLKNGGVLVMPLGTYRQELMTITKSDTGVVEQKVIPVRFVPMTGEAEEH